MLIPFNNGNIYEGKTSYANIAANATQNNFTRLLLAPVTSKCSAVDDMKNGYNN